jgi:hypothetical protein
MERPSGVIGIAAIFFLAAAYLISLGLTMLVAPGVVAMAWGAPLLGGLELAGPYMFLLVGSITALIGWGLLRLNNWARWIAILAAGLGAFMLVPSVSGAVVYFDFARLAWGGLGVMLRVAIIWYLFQEPVREQFG